MLAFDNPGGNPYVDDGLPMLKSCRNQIRHTQNNHANNQTNQQDNKQASKQAHGEVREQTNTQTTSHNNNNANIIDNIITANNKFRKAQGKKGKGAGTKGGGKGGKAVAPGPGKGTKHGLLGSPEVSQQKRQRTGEPGVAAAAAPGNFPSLFAAVKAGAQ